MPKSEKVTVYVMQPYQRTKNRLAPCAPRQFDKRADAESAGEKTLGWGAGAIVYSMEIHPDFEDWSEPAILASWGDVPGDEGNLAV